MVRLKCNHILLIVASIVLDTIQASPKVASDNLNLIRQLSADCKRKLDFKSIKEFRTFVTNFKQLIADDAIELKTDANLKKCLQDQEALFEFDQLVSNYDKKRACKFSEISKLESFAQKHLVYSKSRPLITNFYTLFGVNLGFVCKLNLLANLKQADAEAEQADFIYSMASPLGWNAFINEHTKKSMSFGVSGNGNNVVDRVAKLVPGLTQVDQLEYLEFKPQAQRDKDGIEEFVYEFESNIVAHRVNEDLQKIIRSCVNLDQFYVNLLLSLAKLNHLGLLVEFEQLNKFHERSRMLHKWLAAMSFCQLLARVETGLTIASPTGGADGGQGKICAKIVHDESQLLSRRKLYSYVAQFDEISQQAVDQAWTADLGKGQRNLRSKSELAQESFASKQLKQFIRGLEKDYKASPEGAQV